MNLFQKQKVHTTNSYRAGDGNPTGLLYPRTVEAVHYINTQYIKLLQHSSNKGYIE